MEVVHSSITIDIYHAIIPCCCKLFMQLIMTSISRERMADIRTCEDFLICSKLPAN